MLLIEMQYDSFLRMVQLTRDDFYHNLIQSLITLEFDVRKAIFTKEAPVHSLLYIGPDKGWGTKCILVDNSITNSREQRYHIALCLAQYILASDKSHIIKPNIGLGNDLERQLTLSILMPKDILLANEKFYNQFYKEPQEAENQLLLGMNITKQDYTDRQKMLV